MFGFVRQNDLDLFVKRADCILTDLNNRVWLLENPNLTKIEKDDLVAKNLYSIAYYDDKNLIRWNYATFLWSSISQNGKVVRVPNFQFEKLPLGKAGILYQDCIAIEEINETSQTNQNNE